MGSAATSWAGTGRSLGPLAPAAHTTTHGRGGVPIGTPGALMTLGALALSGTPRSVGVIESAAHGVVEGAADDMDVDTGLGVGASDEPTAASDPEFNEDDDEAIMKHSVEAHVKSAAKRHLSLIRTPCPPNVGAGAA